jgi:hypothetical protein
MRTICVILSIFCLLGACSLKTEILPFENPDSRHIHNSGRVDIAFIIRNPPNSKDRLLNLVFKHSQTFSQNDTMEQDVCYAHEYYKETNYTTRSYKDVPYFYYDYLDHRVEDLLIRITVVPEDNIQDIVFYNYRKRSSGINEYEERRIYIKTVGNEKTVYCVMFNPPKKKDDLMNLASELFQSIVPNDTMERYICYIYKYQKDCYFIPPYHSAEKDIGGTLLITVAIEPKHNKQEIVYIRKGIEKE